eukprot:TRINITY_DN5985_c0_g1_i2.p1 TRINITY_DN5985_c0_g1~~TRINITY_DN5985_c0_g1_i2.p1  ORF type:complete len:411 (-),score=123.73 TRINITY_DN5985_c0_g1_i2:131-1363(-)
MQRLQSLSGQIVPAAGPAKSPNDVVICAAVRTPMTRAKKGLLKDTPPEAMLTPLFENILKKTGIDGRLIEDVVIGNVIQPGAGIMSARIAEILGGIQPTTPLMTVNRMCSSGLEAVGMIAGKIRGGMIDIGIAGGVESMSLFDMKSLWDPSNFWDAVNTQQAAKDCLLSMGETSENVAQQFGISREAQDRLAYQSHQKAAVAQEKGLFDSEIVPVKTKVKDEKGNEKEVLVVKDDLVRKETTVEGLGKLKPVFRKDGATTAGNASPLTDGASLVLLARRSAAERLGLPILARVASFAAVGVPPRIMGIGPAYAIPVALEKAGVRISDVSIFEINEAFASQATYCVEKLGIDWAKVNPKGGAIALGHPLGATGSRQIATLLPELRRTGGKTGVVSMCVGTGMGVASVIVLE